MSDPTCKPGSQVAPELLPCPFCGESLVEHSDHHGSWWAHKDEAGPCVASCWQVFMDEPASIKRWNTRPASDLAALRAENETLRRERDEALKGEQDAWLLVKATQIEIDLATKANPSEVLRQCISYRRALVIFDASAMARDKGGVSNDYLQAAHDHVNNLYGSKWPTEAELTAERDRLRAENDALRRERDEAREELQRHVDYRKRFPLMDAKWLDPECHEGCKSLVLKAERDRLAAELAGRWIPVGERLPERCGMHLCAFKSGNVQGCLRRRDGWWLNGENRAEHITHWQHLPAHPEGGKAQ